MDHEPDTQAENKEGSDAQPQLHQGCQLACPQNAARTTGVQKTAAKRSAMLTPEML